MASVPSGCGLPYNGLKKRFSRPPNKSLAVRRKKERPTAESEVQGQFRVIRNPDRYKSHSEVSCGGKVQDLRRSQLLLQRDVTLEVRLLMDDVKERAPNCPKMVCRISQR